VRFNHNDATKTGIVKYFIKVLDCDCQNVCTCNGTFYAIISVLDVVENFATTYPIVQVDFVYRCEETELTMAIPVTDLNELCIFMVSPQNNHRYVSKPVNNVESE